MHNNGVLQSGQENFFVICIFMYDYFIKVGPTQREVKLLKISLNKIPHFGFRCPTAEILIK